jgi:hypothetical protein
MDGLFSFEDYMNQATQEQPASTGSEQTSSVEDRFAGHLFGEQPEEEQVETPADSAAPEESAPAEAAETPQAPALEEVEFEGEKFQLPSKIKSALMAQQDYTVKTQEVAEQRRMVEMRAQAMQHEAHFQQSVSQELTQLSQLDAQIAQYKEVNWASLGAEDMMRAKFALDQLKEQRSGLEQQIQGKRGEFDNKIQSLRVEARNKGEAFLKKAIPNWGAEVQKELASYGTQEGYSEVELSAVVDPRIIKTLWKAQQYDKLQSQKAASLKTAAKAPPVLKPGASTQQTAKANAENAYRKALREAKSPGERSRIIQERFAQKLG